VLKKEKKRKENILYVHERLPVRRGGLPFKHQRSFFEVVI
jgi:hypothetical protein